MSVKISEIGKSIQPDPTFLSDVIVDLRDRLRSSLSHLLLDVDQVKERRSRSETAIQLHFEDAALPKSSVFAGHKMLRDAAITQDEEAFNWACDLVLSIPKKSHEKSTLSIEIFSEEALGRSAWLALANAYRDDVGLTTDLVAPSELEVASGSDLVQSALALKRDFASDWVREFELLVSEIFLAVNRDKSKSGFGGASVFDAFGSLLVNPNGASNLEEMIMTLVHESSHTRLFLYHLDDPVILNEPQETFSSPLREGQRPMEGIFHAAWVSARMALCARDILEGGCDIMEDLEQQMLNAKEVFDTCSESIVKHAKLSDLGAILFNDAASALKDI